MTHVSDVMTRNVRSMSPDDTVQFAAQAMDELDVGALPVCYGGSLVGMVTDRDIAVRVVAPGLPADTTRVSEVMSQDIECCLADESLDDVAHQMSDAQVRRVPVVDGDRHLIGIVSLADVAAKGEPELASDTLARISEPMDVQY